ncbi:hypothetical protein H5410_021981 [Solanum commersonii]|uniref:Uncharacterized protein n=1 Tax=Solanum commersonii TaxID=4109 RepID=A0A9J5ZGS9_SOLCO|nr:hypothetical protein H5410_021981 [Solanum commersonii]
MFVVTKKVVSAGNALAISAIAPLLVKTCRRLTRRAIRLVAYQDEDRVIPDQRISDLVWGSSPQAINDLWFEAADEAPPVRSVHPKV